MPPGSGVTKSTNHPLEFAGIALDPELYHTSQWQALFVRAAQGQLPWAAHWSQLSLRVMRVYVAKSPYKGSGPSAIPPGSLRPCQALKFYMFDSYPSQTFSHSNLRLLSPVPRPDLAFESFLELLPAVLSHNHSIQPNITLELKRLHNYWMCHCILPLSYISYWNIRI